MHKATTAAMAGLALSLLAGAARADQANDASLAQLREELAELQARVCQLQARRETGWLDERRETDIRGLVADVLADSDTRASLQGHAATAGYDRGFFIGSADGDFRLTLHAMVQSRFMLSDQDENAPDDSSRWGFETPRTRLGFFGHVFDPSWKFLIWGGWIPSGRSWLVEATIMKQFDNGWSVEGGSFKLPLWQEWIISETRQQFVDRSVLNGRYSGAGKGVRAIHQGERMRLHAAFTQGSRTWNTPWNTGPDTTSGAMPFQLSSEYALTAKAELLLNGSWSSRSDFESFPGSEGLFILGAGVHYQVGEYGTDDDENEIFQWVVDATAEFGGANLFAGLIGTHFENSTTKRDEWGFMLQGGYFLTEQWEAVGRFEYGDLDGAGTVSDELCLLTVGLCRFWSGHTLKWITDAGYAFEPIDPGWASASAGWRTDGDDADGQILIRTQLQVLF